MDDTIIRVLQDSKEIRSGLENLTGNLADYFYSSEKRRQLKRTLTNNMAPLMANHGFVKKNSCFLRVHGDALLQIVGIVYPHDLVFYTASFVQPLYDFFCPLSSIYDQRHDLIGLTNKCPDEAAPIEFTLGLNDHRCILGMQKDYDRAFQAICLLLEQKIIPLLDQCIDGIGCLQYDRFDASLAWSISAQTMISLYYRDHMYDECGQMIRLCLERTENTYKEIYENNPLDFAEYSKSEKTAFLYDQWHKAKMELLQFFKQKLTFLETLRDALKKNDHHFLTDLMNQSVLKECTYLSGISKAFSKAFSSQKYLVPVE